MENVIEDSEYTSQVEEKSSQLVGYTSNSIIQKRSKETNISLDNLSIKLKHPSKNEWLPIANKHGVVYFYNKSTGVCQWTYPKNYNAKENKYVHIFMKNWVKVVSPKGTYWKNTTSKVIQNVKPYSTTYLLEAAFMDNFAFVQFYLQINGDVNILDKQGRNALHYAIMNDNHQIVKFLLLNAINIDQADSKFRQTPVFLTIQYRAYNSLKLLIDYGCKLNFQDYKGNSPLHYAIKTKNMKLIFYLVESGGKLSIKNKSGKFPIDLAVEDENWVLVKYLTRLSNIMVFNKKIKNNEVDVMDFDYHMEQQRENIKNKTGSYGTMKNQKKIKKKLTITSITSSDSETAKDIKKDKLKNSTAHSNSLSIDSINFNREQTKKNKHKKIESEIKKDNNIETDLTDNSTSEKMEKIKNFLSKSASTLKMAFCKAYQYSKNKSKKVKDYIAKVYKKTSFYMNNAIDLENQVKYIDTDENNKDDDVIDQNLRRILRNSMNSLRLSKISHNNIDDNDGNGTKFIIEEMSSNVRYIKPSEVELKEKEKKDNTIDAIALEKHVKKLFTKANLRKIKMKSKTLAKKIKHSKLPFYNIFSLNTSHVILKKLVNLNNKNKNNNIGLSNHLYRKIVLTRIKKKLLSRYCFKISNKQTSVSSSTSSLVVLSKDPIEYKIENIVTEHEMRNPVNSINFQSLRVKESNKRYTGYNGGNKNNYYESIMKTLSNIHNYLDVNNVSSSRLGCNFLENEDEEINNKPTDVERLQCPESSRWDDISNLVNQDIFNCSKADEKESIGKSREKEGSQYIEDKAFNNEEEEESEEESNSVLQEILNKYNEELMKFKNKNEEVYENTDESS